MMAVRPGFAADWGAWGAALGMALVAHAAVLGLVPVSFPQRTPPAPPAEVIIETLELASSLPVNAGPAEALDQSAEALEVASPQSASVAATSSGETASQPARQETAPVAPTETATTQERESIAGANPAEAAPQAPSQDVVASAPSPSQNRLTSSTSEAPLAQTAEDRVASAQTDRIGTVTTDAIPNARPSDTAPSEKDDRLAGVTTDSVTSAPPPRAQQIIDSPSTPITAPPTASTSPLTQDLVETIPGQRTPSATTSTPPVSVGAAAPIETRPDTAPATSAPSPDRLSGASVPQTQSTGSTPTDPRPATSTSAVQPNIAATSRPAAVSPGTANPATVQPGSSNRLAALPSAPSTPDPNNAVAAVAPAPADAIPPEELNQYANVLEFLRSYSGGPCFAALPALGERAGQLSLDAFGPTTKRLDQFRAGLEGAAGILPQTHLKPISDAQCATLQFVRDLPSYPEFGLYFELSNREIASGTRLQGRILNAAGQFLHLVVIDDDGLVQSLDSFLTLAGDAVEFSIPLTFQGGPIDTQQLLLAIAAPINLSTTERMNGASAFAFFSALETERSQNGIPLDLSMVAFSVVP